MPRPASIPGWEIATLGDFPSIRRLESRGYRLQRIEMVLGRDLTRRDADRSGAGRHQDRARARRGVGAHLGGRLLGGRDGRGARRAWRTVRQQHPRAGGAAVCRHRRGPALRRVPRTASRRAPPRHGSTRGVYQLCGAATLPAFRRRGVQSALLSARLAEARAANCDLTVVTVEPGSRSQANVQRRGFVPLYSRLVMAREIVSAGYRLQAYR